MLSNSLIIILAIVLVVIIAVVVIFIISKKSKKVEEKPASILDVDNPGVPNSSETTNFSYGYEKEETVVMNPVDENKPLEEQVNQVELPKEEPISTSQSPIPGENITVEVPTTTEEVQNSSVDTEEPEVAQTTEPTEEEATESTEENKEE